VLLDAVTVALSATPVEQPVVRPVGPREQVAAGHDRHGGTSGMGDHGHSHDHENLAFEMLRLDEEGHVKRVEITRDTGGYDENGNDPGTKPVPLAPDPDGKETGVRS
jgi:hypothetical protein